jgi:hypothetical protein
MTLGSGFLNPSYNGTPGYGSFQLTIVDPATIDALRAQLAFNERVTIVTHTQALGETLGGQKVASNVFEFSITACKGCLSSSIRTRRSCRRPTATRRNRWARWGPRSASAGRKLRSTAMSASRTRSVCAARRRASERARWGDPGRVKSAYETERSKRAPLPDLYTRPRQ